MQGMKAALDARAKELDALRAQLDSERQDLERRAARLEDERRAIDGERDEVRAARASVDQDLATIRADRENLSAEQTRFQDAANDLAAREKALREAERNVERLDHEMIGRMREADAKFLAIVNREEELFKLQQDWLVAFETREQELRTITEQMHARQEESAELHESLAHIESVFKDETDRLAAKRQELAAKEKRSSRRRTSVRGRPNGLARPRRTNLPRRRSLPRLPCRLSPRRLLSRSRPKIHPNPKRDPRLRGPRRWTI